MLLNQLKRYEMFHEKQKQFHKKNIIPLLKEVKSSHYDGLRLLAMLKKDHLYNRFLIYLSHPTKGGDLQ